jgi:hypothetical protein
LTCIDFDQQTLHLRKSEWWAQQKLGATHALHSEKDNDGR